MKQSNIISVAALVALWGETLAPFLRGRDNTSAISFATPLAGLVIYGAVWLVLRNPEAALTQWTAWPRIPRERLSEAIPLYTASQRSLRTVILIALVPIQWFIIETLSGSEMAAYLLATLVLLTAVVLWMSIDYLRRMWRVAKGPSTSSG